MVDEWVGSVGVTPAPLLLLKTKAADETFAFVLDI